MKGKILFGALILLGLLGAGFAWGGFNWIGKPAMEMNKTRWMNASYNGTECRTYFTSDEVKSLREDMREVMQAGDKEEVKEIMEQIKENAPDGCRPRMGKRPIRNISPGKSGRMHHCNCTCYRGPPNA